MNVHGTEIPSVSSISIIGCLACFLPFVVSLLFRIVRKWVIMVGWKILQIGRLEISMILDQSKPALQILGYFACDSYYKRV